MFILFTKLLERARPRQWTRRDAGNYALVSVLQLPRVGVGHANRGFSARLVLQGRAFGVPVWNLLSRRSLEPGVATELTAYLIVAYLDVLWSQWTEVLFPNYATRHGVERHQREALWGLRLMA